MRSCLGESGSLSGASVAPFAFYKNSENDYVPLARRKSVEGRLGQIGKV